MKITVKETRVLKTGENKKGKWELIKVTSDDGTEYTTFDKKAKHLNPSAIFEAEVELKEGKASFSEVGTIISQGEAKPQGERGSTNASIEAQVAFKGMVELLIADKLDRDESKATIRWAMKRIALPTLIVTKIEEVKGEATKDNTGDKEAQGELADRQNSREATNGEVKNAGDLFSWIMSKDLSIKNPRLWVQTEFGLDDKEVLTDKKAIALYQTIKKKMGW